MTIKVTFACGHAQEWKEGTSQPVCQTCGERRISRAAAPNPTFRGACESPLKGPSDAA